MLLKHKNEIWRNNSLKILIFLLLTPWCTVLLGQKVSIKNSRELGITTTAVAWTAINYTWQFQTPKIPNSYHRWQVIGLDNLPVHSVNNSFRVFSDLTLGATLLASGLSIWNKENNNTFKNSVVMFQSIWISTNIAHSIKIASKRARPYTMVKGFTMGKRDDTYSFFSGHSAMAASAITSAILMYGSSSFNGQKILLVSGGTLAAATMVLRVLAGKHYPSDVLTGALVGIGIAWLNYQIHEK